MALGRCPVLTIVTTVRNERNFDATVRSAPRLCFVAGFRACVAVALNCKSGGCDTGCIGEPIAYRSSPRFGEGLVASRVAHGVRMTRNQYALRRMRLDQFKCADEHPVRAGIEYGA